jgi:hypothetical protein
MTVFLLLPAGSGEAKAYGRREGRWLEGRDRWDARVSATSQNPVGPASQGVYKAWQ